jgi:hypothetical protein
MFIVLKFIDEKHNTAKEKVINNVINLLKDNLLLPKSLTVEFRKLSPHFYAETNLSLSNNRTIILNCMLTEKEIITPLIHELIHIDQIENKKLMVYKNGDVYWLGKRYSVEYIKRCTYAEYQNLPWENEVLARQQNLLKLLLGDL